MTWKTLAHIVIALALVVCACGLILVVVRSSQTCYFINGTSNVECK